LRELDGRRRAAGAGRATSSPRAGHQRALLRVGRRGAREKKAAAPRVASSCRSQSTVLATTVVSIAAPVADRSHAATSARTKRGSASGLPVLDFAGPANRAELEAIPDPPPTDDHGTNEACGSRSNRSRAVALAGALCRGTYRRRCYPRRKETPTRRLWLSLPPGAYLSTTNSTGSSGLPPGPPSREVCKSRQRTGPLAPCRANTTRFLERSTRTSMKL
jgi:hypothetical protein